MTSEAQLLYAAWCGDTPRVRVLLKQGVAVDTPDGKGRTPLMLAATNHATETVALLLAAGANTTVHNKGNRPLIDYVTRADIGRLILAHTPSEKRGALATRILFNEHAEAELLQCAIDAGGTINARNKRADTPLICQSWSGLYHHSPNAGPCLLLAAGADFRARNSHQHSPMLLALWVDHVDLAKLYLDAGLSPNEPLNDEEERPLHHAYSVDMVQTLLAAGADANSADKNGRTPLHSCAFRNRAELVPLLLAAEANPTLRDNQGKTPAEVAMKRSHTDVLQQLTRSA